MLLALTALVLAAAPATANSASFSVAVTRQVGLDTAAALELAELFSLALERQGDALPARRVSARAFAASLAAANTDPASCAGALDCAAVLGQVGKVDWLFALQLAKVGSNVIFDANLVQVRDGSSLASVNKAVRFKDPGPDLEALAKELLGLAAPLQPPPPEQAVAPVATGPAAPTPPAAARTQEGLGAGALTSLVLGGLAAVAVAGGAALGTTALLQADTLSSTAASYSEDRERVLWIARGADLAYVAGAGLATAALVVLLVVGPEAAEDATTAPTRAGSAGDLL